MSEHNSTLNLKKSAQTAIFSATNQSAIGIDVHLDKIVFCYQNCAFNSSKLEERNFTSKGNLSDINNAASICKELNPDVILMESTGVYWLSIYEALENVGFMSEQLIVLNARDVKAARGRKTDLTDARRITELGRSGKYRQSFIPDRIHRQYRTCFRALQAAKRTRQRAVNQLHKLLCSVGARASTVFSDIRGKAATIIIEALAANASDDKLLQIIEENSKRLKHSPEEIFEALRCDKTSPVWNVISKSIKHIKFLDDTYEEQLAELKSMVIKTDKDLFLRLQKIPGISELSALGIVCELSSDAAKSFDSAKKLSSWAGLSPGNSESAGKRFSGKCAKGNKYLRGLLMEAAHACMHCKDCYLADKAKKLKARRGGRKAVVALAHNLLRVIFAMIRDGSEFINEKKDVLTPFCLEKLQQATDHLSRNTKLKVDNKIIVVDQETGAVKSEIVPSRQSKRRGRKPRSALNGAVPD